MSEEKAKILIVDDESFNIHTLNALLKNDYKIMAASNGEQAILGAINGKPDLILLDIMMDGMDGYEVFKRLKVDWATCDIPVIFITAMDNSEDETKGFELGVVDYITKPFNKAVVLARVRTHIRLKQKNDQLENLVFEAKKREQQIEARNIELKESNNRIVDILESINDAFFALDTHWCFSYFNSQAEDLLKAERKQMIGHNMQQELPNTPDWFMDAMQQSMNRKISVTAEGRHELLGKWLEVKVYPGSDGISVYFRDISERKQAEQRLNYLANYDALTELPNRSLLMDRLEQALTRAPWHDRSVAVLFCDLDRFKIINDTLGHNAGDQVLNIVAQRFLRCVRNGDTVARLGGDEFVILLTDLARSYDVSKLADKIIHEISQPLMLEEQEVYVTTSVGISVFPDDGYEADVLLKQADIAMYQAKEKGKNSYQIYSESLNTRTTDRLTLEGALRRALDGDELQVYYQPQIDLKTNNIVSAEALIRWQHPEMGLIAPVDFLPIAKETGLMAAIDKWVMARACKQNKSWRDMGLPSIRIAVNMSDQLFHQEDLVQTVANILADADLPADGLELELTEAVIMRNPEQAVNILNQLQEMGVKIAIDDFGTGYSSLGHLKHYPIQTIKIDRSFVSDLPHDSDDAAITEAILAMSNSLGLTVVAEGIETIEQHGFLKNLDCKLMQGFLFSQPLDAAKFHDMLQRNFKEDDDNQE